MSSTNYTITIVQFFVIANPEVSVLTQFNVSCLDDEDPPLILSHENESSHISISSSVKFLVSMASPQIEEASLKMIGMNKSGSS